MNPFESTDQPTANTPAQPPKAKKPKLSLEGCYLEIKGRRVWMETPQGWIDVSFEDFAVYLHGKFGISNKGKPSPARKIVSWLQQNQWVHVASDLAGYHGPQVLEYDNKRILILHGPNLLVPVEGDYATILQLLDGMLPGEPGEHLCCWCADVLRHVYDRKLGSFIVPILCGPRNCGKSLFQKLLTVAAGGRVSFPYSVMTGGTPFNEHLFAAEHLMIEDEHSSGDLKSRNQLGTAIKNFVANERKLNHGKGKMPFTMPQLLQFMTVSLNDGLENIGQLPRKHPSIDDKASLYGCQYSPMPMPTRLPEEKKAFWAQLMKELPCWIYDLIHKTPMPEKWQTGRFMVPWRADSISEALDELEPYMKFRELIRILLWSGDNYDSIISIERRGNIYVGTPTQIESDLRREKSPVKTLADDLLRNPVECGRLLTRLCEHFPTEYQFRRTKHARYYQLFRPVTDDIEVT